MSKSPISNTVSNGSSPRATPNLAALEDAAEAFTHRYKYHVLGSTPDIRFTFTRHVTIVARQWRNSMNRELKPLDQTQASWVAMFWIAASAGGQSQDELAELVGVEGPTLVRIIDRLERQGLVQREVMEGNKRANRVRLTTAAEPVMERIVDIADDLRRKMLDGVTEEELAVVDRVLRKAADNLGKKAV